MNRKRSRKTSKRKSKTVKRRSRKNVKRSSYRFPRTLEVLGLCVTDTRSNYNKIYGSILPKLNEQNIIRDDDTINFCMLNLETHEQEVFDCQIRGDYGNEFIPQVDNKKYDILILDGCPLRTNISIYDENRIRKLENNLKDDGYLLITTPSEKIPEQYMQNRKGKSSAPTFLNIFFKQHLFKKNLTYLHVYRKIKTFASLEEDEPGSVIEGPPGGIPFGFRF